MCTASEQERVYVLGGSFCGTHTRRRKKIIYRVRKRKKCAFIIIFLLDFVVVDPTSITLFFGNISFLSLVFIVLVTNSQKRGIENRSEHEIFCYFCCCYFASAYRFCGFVRKKEVSKKN